MLGVAVPAHAASAGVRAAPPRAASAQPAIALNHPLLAGRVHLSLPLRAATAASTPVPAKSCYTYDTPDATGDTTGGLDAVDYQLSSTCGAWIATITASRPFVASQLGAFEIDFDTDNNLSDGCDGMDSAFVVEPVPDGVSLIAAQFIFKGCTAEQAGSLDVTRPSSESVSIAFSDFFGDKPGTRFRSVAFLTGSANPKPSDLDRVPNTGLVTSQRSMSSAFDIGGAGVFPLNHVYTQVVSGDFNGDGYEDVLYYAAGGESSIEYGRHGAAPVSAPVRIWGTYHLVAGDFNGDGITDLLLYAPGSAPDAIWYGSRSHTFTAQPYTINGSYQIVSGDFNGDGADDLLFYAPGTAADYIWFGSSGRTFHSTLAPPINNPYRIAAGDFNGDGFDDVVLYAPGAAPDYVMEGSAAGRFSFAPLSINGDYAMLLPGDFNGDGADDLVLFNPGTGYDELMLGGSAPGAVLTPGPQTVIDEDYVAAVVGDFGNDGADAILFVAPPTFGSGLWYGLRHTTDLAFSSFGAVSVDPSNGRVLVTSGPTGTEMEELDPEGHVTGLTASLDGPSGVAFGPSTVFVAMAGGHSIAEFDRTTLTLTGTIDTGTARAAPTSLTYQNGKLWFTFWAGGSVGAHGGLGMWDPNSATVSTSATDITSDPLFASGTASTNTLVVYSGPGPGTPTGARYDVSTGAAVLTKLESGGSVGPGGCNDVAVSPDQAHVWTVCNGGDAVFEQDAATLQLDGTQYRTDSMPPNALAATSMQGGVLVTDAEQLYTNDVYIDRIGGGTLRLYELNNVGYELNSNTYARGIALSPDGHRLYDVSIANGQFGMSGPTLVRVLDVP
ncbi:MAG TPA: FG-GAP-like repeat-containing protein [Acidimicrobiia bacterium]